LGRGNYCGRFDDLPRSFASIILPSSGGWPLLIAGSPCHCPVVRFTHELSRALRFTPRVASYLFSINVHGRLIPRLARICRCVCHTRFDYLTVNMSFNHVTCFGGIPFRIESSFCHSPVFRLTLIE